MLFRITLLPERISMPALPISPFVLPDIYVVRLQCFHDLRLVRPSPIQGIRAAARHHGELGIALFEYWLAVGTLMQHGR
jgi:hypothetical protein